MKTVYARNVNEAYVIGMNMLKTSGVEEDSRFGKVLVLPDPVATTYTQPMERVLFNKERDCNPFFHLMESLWMLQGRNDVKWIEEFSSSIGQFSDNGINFNAAYGHRWRLHFVVDQIETVINELEQNPQSRRAVIGMWDPQTDLNKEGKDFPCNLAISFRVQNDTLDMTVFNRSNDIIWGAYGANAVHMSILQEYIATRLELTSGKYHQVSNNFHAYLNILEKVGVPDPLPIDPYEYEVTPRPLIDEPDQWMQDLNTFMDDSPEGISPMYINSFFSDVAEPMRRSWRWYKNKDYPGALDMADHIAAADWKLACHQWLTRRFEKHGRKKQVHKIAED